MTLQDKHAAFLIVNGCKEVFNNRTLKYRVFESRKAGVFYFLGRAGAVREGRTATESHPVTLRLGHQSAEELGL